jgi:lycopene beta-cyclase
MIKDFNHIIAGSGCAGLSLAYHLHMLGYSGTLLIVDRELKLGNDRTWCSWADGATPFDDLAQHCWSSLMFADPAGEKIQPLNNYRYQLLRSADFYRHIRQTLEVNPNVHFLTAEITALGEVDSRAYLIADGQKYTADYLFNSTQPLPQARTNEYSLLQHFMGWWVRTPTPQFNPQLATLMDFRVPQHGQTRFAYVLPIEPQLALVEFTIFSAHTLSDMAYEGALENYIHDVLGITDYTIEEREFGVIPMSNVQPVFAPGQRVIPIGRTGGAVKPTTGYAFQRIQQQTQQLARQIINNQALDPRLPKASRFRFYDNLLLHILSHHGHWARSIFSRLFRHNPYAIIMRFLDEETRLDQELGLLASLPPRPFIQAIIERQLGWPREVFLSPITPKTQKI